MSTELAIAATTFQERSNEIVQNKPNILELTTNSNYTQHKRMNATSPQESRDSSVSSTFTKVPLKEGPSELLTPSSLMPPGNPCPSRLSTSSAWNNIRLSALSLSRVFFLKPCSKHKCCLGCISLRDAIPLICSMEIFTLVFCTTFAIEFWINNGKVFYTSNFEGYGTEIAIGYLAFFIVSVAVILFTLSVWKNRRRNWYIVHVIWQWTVIELFVYFIYLIACWIKSDEVKRQSILLPSAIVLAAVTSFGALVELWWLIVFVDAMLFEKNQSSYGSRRTSNGHRVDLESNSSYSPVATTQPNIRVTEN